MSGYFLFSWYDQAAHFTGGAACAGLVFSFLRRLTKTRIIQIGRWGLTVFSIAITGFLGSLYEIEEYLEDFFRGSHRLGDGFDTANDMLLNALGAVFIILLFILFAVAKSRKKL